MSDPAGTAGAVQYYVNSSTFGGDKDKLFLDTSNVRLGIGTDSPETTLHISAAVPEFRLTDSDGGYATIQASTGNLTIAADDGDNQSNSNIAFEVDNSEKMRILNDGNVGIGTTSPTSPASVAKILEIEDAQHAGIVLHDSTVEAWEIFANAGDLKFRYNNVSGSETTLKSDGKVGIGVTDLSASGANAKLGVASGFINVDDTYGLCWGGGTGRPNIAGSKSAGTITIDNVSVGVGIGGTPAAERLEIINSGTDTAPALRITNDAQSWNLATRGDLDDNFVIRDVTGGVNALTIAKSTGNVGIGLTSPDSTTNLHIYDANPKVRLQDSDETNVYTEIFNSSGDTQIRSRDGSSNGIFSLMGNNGTTDQYFLRIDASGDVGIGTSGPNIGTWGNALTLDSGGAASTSCALELSKSGTLYGFLGVQGSGSSNALDIAAYQSQDIRLRVGSSAGTTAMTVNSDGNVGIGITPGSAYRLYVSGKPVRFISDGAASNGAVLELVHANNNSTDVVSTLAFANNVGAVAHIQGGTTGGNTNGYISFHTDDSGTSTERMRITSDGRVDVDSILQSGLLYHNVLQFFHNGTISNGVKIKTNFPFDSANENAMPTIIIEGYDYRGARTIGLQIAWYPYSSSFIQGTVSSFGSYTPVVKLAREDDKVIIHLGTDETDWYYDSFNVRVLHNFVNSDQSSELIGWTWADEAITGDRIATLTYNNKVGNLTTEGNVGIGTSSLNYPLTVTEGSSSIGFAEYNNGANIWLDGSNGDFSGADYYNILADGNTALRFGYAGSTKVSMLSNGYFGIGDGTPSRPLCVKHGDSGTLAAIKIENTSSGDASIWFKETGSEWVMGLDNSDSNSFKISNSSELGSSDMLTIDTNGNVGIGVSSPLNAGLTISTNSATLTLNDTGFSGYSWTFDQNSGDGSLRIIKSDETTGATEDTPLAILGTGLVGVGKTAPAYALDVDGIVNCTSLRFADGTSISTTPTGTVLLRDLNPAAFNYDMHVAGKVGIGTTSPDHSLEIDGGSGTDLLHLNSDAPIVKVTATNNSSGLRINTVGQSSGQLFRVQKDGTTRFQIDADGSVGIGTTSPAQRLEVSRSSNGGVIPICISNRDTTAGTNQSTSIGFGLSRNSGAFKDRAGKIQVGRELDWTAADTNIDAFMAFYTYQNNAESEKMRIKANGNVGIGTSSPAFKTEIVGDTLAIHDGAGEGSGRILFDEQSNGTYGFSLGYSGVSHKSFDGTDDGYPSNTFFIARHNNSKSFSNVLMSNRDNGHIGFGSGWGSGSSVYPNSFLHSKGPERLGSDMYASATKLGLIVEDTTGSASHKLTGMVDVEHNPTGKTISRICTSRTNLGSRIFFLTSNNYSNGVNHNPLTLNYDGRIGLNDTSPNATIDVYQSGSHSTNDIRLRRSTNHSAWATWSYNGATCFFGTAHDDALGFTTNDTERMRVAENGNVGVATTSPAYKLDVNGTLRCQTLIFKDGTSFSSVGAVGNKAIAVNVGNGSSNPEGRAKSVVDATYGGIQNGLVLVYYYYRYASHCGNGGCTRTAYRKRAYQVVDGNWTSIFDF